MELFRRVPKVGQEVAVNQIVEVVRFGLHDLVLDGQRGQAQLLILDGFLRHQKRFAINSSGVMESAPWMYPPFWRIDGNTSSKIQHSNSAVNIAFRDKEHFLFPAAGEGAAFHRPLAMRRNCVLRPFVPQCRRHVLAAEQHLSVLVDSARSPKLLVLKNYHFVHVISSLLQTAAVIADGSRRTCRNHLLPWA